MLKRLDVETPQVMELNGWSSRALVNWGRAMCVRAELAYDADTAAAAQSNLPAWQQQQQQGRGRGGTGIAEQLYQKAIDKFEAVLEAEPDKIAVKVGIGGPLTQGVAVPLLLTQGWALATTCVLLEL